jgi:hypothetical protein
VTGLARSSSRPTLRPSEQPPVNPLDDERTLSIFANGAYYLSGARLREIGVALLGVHQARGGVDVPSPEKHR